MKQLRKAIHLALGGAVLAAASTSASALDTYIGDLAYGGSTVSLNGNLLPQGWNGSNNGGLGWGHNSDWYRLQVTATGSLDLRVQATASGVQPAFSLWSTGTSGFDTSIGGAHSYSQIGDNSDWSGVSTPFVGLANNNAGGCAPLSQCGNSYGPGPGPGAAPGVTASIGSEGAFSYAQLFLPNVTAGSWYLIAVGGSGGSGGGYTISAGPAAVPIPAAVWLFGSALAGVGAIGRRRKAPS